MVLINRHLSLNPRLLALIWFALFGFITVLLGLIITSSSTVSIALSFSYASIAALLGAIMGFIYGYRILNYPRTKANLVKTTIAGFIYGVLLYLVIVTAILLFLFIMVYVNCHTEPALNCRQVFRGVGINGLRYWYYLAWLAGGWAVPLASILATVSFYIVAPKIRYYSNKT